MRTSCFKAETRGAAVADRVGLWPGVVAFANDADLWCVQCARRRYGRSAVSMVIDGGAGYEHYTDHEGNPLNVVLCGSTDLHGMYCGSCSTPLCDDDCSCYLLPQEVERLLEEW